MSIDVRKFALLLSAPCDSAFELADASRRLYRKELIYVGSFKAPDGRRYDVDKALVDHWARTGGELITAGFKAPLPLEHVNAGDPEKNRGEIVGYETGPDARGNYGLFGLVQFSDEEAEKLKTRANVSIYSPPQFRYAGRVWKQPITHVALTNYPVVSQLDGFQTIAASFAGEFRMAIDWSSIQAELELPEEIELTDDTAVGLILLKVRELKKRIEDLGGEVEKPSAKPAATTPGEETPPINASASPVMMSLLRDNRRMRLDALSQSGRLTKPARDKIERNYLNDATLTLSCGGAKDGFDELMEVIGLQPPVVPTGERTRGQTVVLSRGSEQNQGAKTSIVADAERRAEEAAKRRGRR